MEKGQFDEETVKRLKRMTWLYERLPRELKKENKIVQERDRVEHGPSLFFDYYSDVCETTVLAIGSIC